MTSDTSSRSTLRHCRLRPLKSSLLPFLPVLLKCTVSLCSAVAASETQSPYLYDCPDAPLRSKARNDIKGYFTFHVENSVNAHKRGEKEDPDTYYLNGFRNSLHGGHHSTYSEYKDKVTRFRSLLFGDNLEDGDIIYEGAGAEGMSMLMTLEILEEEEGITGLTAYGHDYFYPFVEIANKLFDAQVAANGSWMKRGRYCQGDSTDLYYVPSNSFDLAYTYVDPLIDGIGRYGDESGDEVRVEGIRALCTSNDEEDQEIIRQDQLLQEQWHSDWVKELVRITKPGTLVVIENVEGPICTDEDSSWGGVAPAWWTKAAEKYEWDVDVHSIRLYDESWFHRAYHVSMRKNSDDDDGEREEEFYYADDEDWYDDDLYYDGDVYDDDVRADGPEEAHGDGADEL